ncbi:sialidase family protein [Qaidamihabitans albus]|uniref:sialidase family protein n=1 Tax=Qaidamihabitans albus TaxID=2795733 RepID=UPI0018F1D343|nr:sialidase family protein [Qaidamihabitans albus]
MPAVSRRAALSLTAAALAGLTVAPAAAAAPPAPCTASVPYTSGTGGYHTFRIPALVRTASGELLAFAEGRVESAGDTGAIEVVLRRSADGGCTWGPLSVVSSNGDATAGNPSPVVLGNGDIVLLTTRNGRVTEREIMAGTVSDEDTRRVFVQRSTDGGSTWSAAREITGEAKAADWRWYATGPGHAIVLRHREHAGRIVVPANHSSAPPAGSPDIGTEAKYYGGHDLLSDDGGHTWRIGFSDDRTDGHLAANETTVAELPDGTLYFNSRDHGTAPGHRVDAYSTDGGETLVEPYQAQPSIVGPRVQGSVLQTSKRDVLLYSGPSDPDARRSMSVRISDDGGRTWRDASTVSDAPAAYSDLAQLDRRTIGLLYETGESGPYETITFERLPLPRA